MKPLHILFSILLIFLLYGCMRNISPDTYAVGSVGQVNRAVKGMIVNARQVNVSGSQSGLGAAAGAGAGGVAGSAIGGAARENIVGAIGGAVVGGVIGAMVEEGATRQQGMEYVVETENGSLITVVQGAEPQLVVGQKVIVIYGQRSRVIADNRQ
jgi:outer membrane lipoprotein SlyB